jgi:hypothetical protein
LVGRPEGSVPHKSLPDDEIEGALNLMTIIDFEVSFRIEKNMMETL